MSDAEADENSSKRPSSSEGNSLSAKRSRGGGGGNSFYDKRIDMRLLIPVSMAGAIIGKAGKNISDMRQEFNASIQIPDSDSYERVVCVSAPTVDELGNLCGRITEVCKERGENRNMDIRILIHKSQAGILIGVKGYKIKELRETTGAHIKVYQDCCPNSSERICQIRGEFNNIVHGVKTVMSLLDECPPKGQVVRYDPNNGYDESYEYGGYQGDLGNQNTGYSGGQMQGYNRGNNNRNNTQMPSANFPINNSGGFYNQTSTFQSPNQQNVPTSFPTATTYNGPANTVKVGNSYQSKVTIPTNLAGSIIGKAGSRIKQIRQDCGAKIKIDEPEPGSTDRVITILGTQEQIQNAQYLLQQCVKLFASQNY